MSSTENKILKREVAEIIIYIFIGLLLVVILPVVGGFVFRGFEEGFREGFSIDNYLGKFIVYLFLMMGAIFLIIFPIARLIKGNKMTHPSEDKDPNFMTMLSVSLIHSPEENGALYQLFESNGYSGNKNPMRWSFSILRVLVIAILVFGVFGILTLKYPQMAVAGVPAQQLTPASDVIFGAGVPSFSENGVLCIVFFLLLGVVAYLCAKLKWGKSAFFLLAFLIICPLMGLFWASFHNIAYAGSDAKWFSTFIFGWLGSTITLLFANFLWWLVWHFMNNAFLKLSEVIPIKEDIIFIAIVIWFILLVAWIGIELATKKKTKSGDIYGV